MSGFVCGGSVAGLIAGLISLGITIVSNISDVTGITVDVIVDVLLATVGEDNPVVSLGVVTIASLVLTEIVVIIVLHGPIKFVVSGGLKKLSGLDN